MRDSGALRRASWPAAVLCIAVGGFCLNLLYPFTVRELGHFDAVPSPTLNFRETFPATRLNGGITLSDFNALAYRPHPGQLIDELSFETEQEPGGVSVLFLNRGGERTVSVRFAHGSEARSGLFETLADGTAARLAAFPSTPARPRFRVRLTNTGGTARVFADDTLLLEFPGDRLDGARLGLGSEQSPVRFADFRMLTRVRERKYMVSERFDHPGRNGMLWIGMTAAYAALWAALLGIARVIVRRPSAALFRAMLPGAALATAVIAALAFVPGRPVWVFAASTAPPLVSWAVTLVVMRRESPLNVGAAPGADGRWRLAAAALSVAALAAAAAGAHGAAVRDAAGTVASLVKTPVRADAPVTVGVDRIIHFKDFPVRDGVINANLTLNPGGKVEIFFRRLGRFGSIYRYRQFINREFVDWYGLRLSAIPGDPGGFIKSSEIRVLGGIGTVEPGVPHVVTISMKGGAFAASVDGREAAVLRDADFGYGDCGVVALAGSATVSAFEVRPDPASVMPDRTAAAVSWGIAGGLLAIVAPLLLALAAGLRPVRAAWTKGLVLELCALVPAAVAASALIARGTGIPPRILLAVIPLWVIPWLGLFLYLNFDACRRPNAALALLVALGLVSAEVAVRQSSYGVRWRADYGGGYVRSEFLDWAAEPGSRVWDSYINKLGLRGRDVSWRRPAGTVRIVCIGGSSTFGDGLARDEETYPHQLEKTLAARFPDVAVEVLNAGVSGYSSFQGVRYLEKKLLDLQPDLVVIDFGNNDKLPAPGGVPDAGVFRRREEAARRGPGLPERIARALLDVRIFYGAVASLAPKDSGVRRVEVAEYRKNLGRAKALAADRGFALMLLNEQTTDFASRQPYLQEYYDANAGLSADGGAVTADPGPLFNLHKDDALFHDFVHPTARGNALIAQAVADRISETGVLNRAVTRARAENVR